MKKVHPKIHELIVKCYFYLEDYAYLIEILNILPLSKKFDLEKYKEENRKNIAEDTRNDPEALREYESSAWSTNSFRSKTHDALVNHLKKLPDEDIFKILKDLLGNPKFKSLKNTKWNYFGDFVKDWPSEIRHYLEVCGVKYDEESKKFIDEEDKDSIQKAINTPNLLDTEFKETFYKGLKEEINKCYKMGAYTATFVLLRKLIENLSIDILRLKFPASNDSQNMKKYYNSDKRRFWDFDLLIQEIKSSKEEFQPDEGKIEEFLRLVNPFKSSANSKAHSLVVKGTKEEIDHFQVETIVEILVTVKHHISN